MYHNRLITCILGLIILLCAPGCQEKKFDSNVELQTLDLLRGDLVLCSGQSFGEVSFSLSCKYSVQETFNLAVALLHSFQYMEAEKTFVKVLDADPECAMAYWGVAMSIYHTLWFEPSNKELEKGSALLDIASRLSKTEKEEMYLEAMGVFYKDWDKIDHKTRAISYEKKMEKLYESDKDDSEVAIFYALALNSTADPKDEYYTKQKRAGEILENLFIDQPNHPGIAHYIIHNYDNPVLAPKALNTARKYAEIAPASSHAQHMPSHIFTRLGLWDESIQSNLKSAESSQCYTQESGIEGAYFEEVHAIDYLVYAYLQKGDNAKALAYYKHIQDMQKVNPASINAVVYPFAAIPARMALENKNWSEAAKVELHPSDVNWEIFPWQKAILHYAKSLGAAHSGDFKSATNDIESLKKLRESLLAIGDSYKSNQVLIQITSAQAWLKFEKGSQDEGLALMREASALENNTAKHPVTPGEVLPSEELLGDMLLQMNKPMEALAVYESNLNVRPNRFNGIYGAAVAAKNAGNIEKSKSYFERLLKLTESSQSNRSEINEARRFVANSESL